MELTSSGRMLFCTSLSATASLTLSMTLANKRTIRVYAFAACCASSTASNSDFRSSVDLTNWSGCLLEPAIRFATASLLFAVWYCCSTLAVIAPSLIECRETRGHLVQHPDIKSMFQNMSAGRRCQKHEQSALPSPT